MERLKQAAQAGDIDTLYSFMGQDPCLLELIDDMKCFVETPFHVAASSGQTIFALEILRLKPSLAYKANTDGFSPMHVALQHEQIEMALRLLYIRGDLVRVKGREGVTPLHYVVEQGNKDLLLRFLSVCPEAIEDVTVRNETALHIALKEDQLESFGVLFLWLEVGYEEGLFWKKKILNWKDNEGNSILQLAMSRRQTQVVKLLKECRVTNYLDGWTAPQEELLDVEAAAAATAAAEAEAEDGMDLRSATFLFLRNNENFLRMDQRLTMAAQHGNTDALYAILSEDPRILERIDQVPFIDTPLHIAAFAGKTRFALEIMRLKPSFATKVNQDGLSPLHLALKNRAFKTAFELLAVDEELVHVKAKDGITPLHYAAAMGNADVLVKLIITCPKAVEDVTIQGETALHIAVQNNNLDCLQMLHRWLRMVSREEVLKWTNYEGKSIVDFATENNRPDVDNILRNFYFVPDRHTTEAPSPLFEILMRGNLCLLMLLWQSAIMTKEDYSMVLVAITLIVTVTYQAVVSPPGGVWQGDPSILFQNQIDKDDANYTAANSTNAKILNAVGKTIMPKGTWLVFSILNTVAFTFSLHLARALVILHTKRALPWMTMLVYVLLCCYGVALYVIGPAEKLTIVPIVLCALLFHLQDIIRIRRIPLLIFRKGQDQPRQKIIEAARRKCKRFGAT